MLQKGIKVCEKFSVMQGMTGIKSIKSFYGYNYYFCAGCSKRLNFN